MHKRQSVRTSSDGEVKVHPESFELRGVYRRSTYIPSTTILQRYAQRAHISLLALPGRRPRLPKWR
jgi:hypothetical protein